MLLDLRISANRAVWHPPTLAENPGFSRNQGEIRKETDCLLEGDGFEISVPRCANTADSVSVV